VLNPRTQVLSPGFSDSQLPLLQQLLQDFLAEEKLGDHIVWFYTPMALPLLQDLRPRAIVYDCMDELSAFKNAPQQLMQRESALLRVANVVFTGGPSLYRAKRSRHPNVHCFPSSADHAHFSQGRDRANQHRGLNDIPKPRLGFFGVIDERLDVEIITRLADKRPGWQIILVGPVIKIDPSILPKRPNIHYFGQQPYADLPRFLAGWDVCLLPFACNAATRFISSTKTLEYMAAEKPIVSTPITDVAEPYGAIIYLADSATAFIAACEEALLATPEELASRHKQMRHLVGSTSWETTAAQVRTLIEAAFAEGLNPLGSYSPPLAA
jgi:UDP-galactopyranose mutase